MELWFGQVPTGHLQMSIILADMGYHRCVKKSLAQNIVYNITYNKDKNNSSNKSK